MSIDNMTGSERVLYKSYYQFAYTTLEMVPAEAEQAAMKKILSVRALGKRKDIIKY
jgi:hypothetical protein